MTDNHDLLVGVPSHEIVKNRAMRSRTAFNCSPPAILHGPVRRTSVDLIQPTASRIVDGQALPLAMVDVHEIVSNVDAQSERIRDRTGSLSRALEWLAYTARGCTGRRAMAYSGLCCLRASAFGQRQIITTAETRRIDAGHVAMAHELIVRWKRQFRKRTAFRSPASARHADGARAAPRQARMPRRSNVRRNRRGRPA